MKKKLFKKAAIVMAVCMAMSMMTGCGAKKEEDTTAAVEDTEEGKEAEAEDDEENYDTGDPVLDDTIKIPNEFVNNGRFREWKYNRVISNLIVEELLSMGYDARLVVPENTDISL